jgi:putative ABC transport system permease protein
VLSDFLPVDVSAAPSLPAIALGIGMGVWVAVAFALLPLLAVRLVSPLAAIRSAYESGTRVRDRWRWPAAAVLAASVVALAALQVGSWRTGFFFAGGIAIALAVLRLSAAGLIRAVRRWFPSGWPYVWRQGLANLYRPANQTATVVLALGFGAFLLATLFLVQHNLLRQLQISGGPERPNLVLFDIQTDQRDAVMAALRADSLPVIGPVPIVPMRILSVKGRPVARLIADTAAQEEQPSEEGGNGGRGSGRRGGARGDGEVSNAWAFRREYRSTYRDTTVASEKVVSGHWWGRGGAPGSAISVEQGLATELGIGLGDEIVWDVQGVPLPTRVASLREVDWARFEPNFFVVFEPGLLEKAPQSLVTLSRVPDAAARGRLQRSLAERFPNVTTLDLSVVQEALEKLVARVALAIRFMAAFSLATGAVVLLGAVATSRYQRVREGALLKTLGASRSQVLRIALAEYLSLGALAAAVALLLAAVAGWALSRFVFDTPFTLPLPALGALGLLVVAGTAAVGLANSLEVVRKTPLEVLRGE